MDVREGRHLLHQLNNKMAQVLAYAELLQMSLSTEKEKERVKYIISGALEARQITAQLMAQMPKSDDSSAS
ncbi:MAG: hypothetical protein AB1898_12200 [Acidobacteriota bacterium]